MSTEPSSLTSELIAFAEAGEHTQFKYLRNLKDYLFMLKAKRTLRYLVDSIQISADNLFNTYCQEVSCGTESLDKILAYSALQDIIRFYEDEYLIILNILQEFKAYVREGHLLDTIFLVERSDEDLWDHRGK